jgi:hypothetical protein
VLTPVRIAVRPIFQKRCQPYANGEQKRKIKGKQQNMKNQTNTNLVIRSSLALALALAIWSPVQARAAEPAEGKSMTEAKMIMSQCPMMKGIDEKSGMPKRSRNDC